MSNPSSRNFNFVAPKSKNWKPCSGEAERSRFSFGPTPKHTPNNGCPGNIDSIKSALCIGKYSYLYNKCISEMLNVCVKGHCIYEMFCVTVMNWNQWKIVNVNVNVNAKIFVCNFIDADLLYKSLRYAMLNRRYIFDSRKNDYLAQKMMFCSMT